MNSTTDWNQPEQPAPPSAHQGLGWLARGWESEAGDPGQAPPPTSPHPTPRRQAGFSAGCRAAPVCTSLLERGPGCRISHSSARKQPSCPRAPRQNSAGGTEALSLLGPATLAVLEPPLCHAWKEHGLGAPGFAGARARRAAAASFLSPAWSLGNACVGESEGRQAARCPDSFSHWGVTTWLHPGLDSPFGWLCDLRKVTRPL